MTLPADSPNLQLAAARLRRIQWTWAVLLGAMAVLTFAQAGGSGGLPESIILGLAWLACAILVAATRQPALLSLVAVVWALSLVFLIPAGAAIGTDPLRGVLGGSPIESWAGALARLLLAITAWNQFLFYRMLYGTTGASGLSAELPAIPEVVPNRTDGLATWARASGLVALLAAGDAIAFSHEPFAKALIALSWSLAAYGIGLGLGAAFSPTTRRGAALTGVGAGALAFLAAVLAGRVLAG